jgi:magnesium and cobalt transporter
LTWKDDMSDTTDGPRPDAQSAEPEQSEEGDSQSRGFFSRIIEALSPSDGSNDQDDPGKSAGMVAGMVNLRRMRVEDVMIPKADIVAVPASMSEQELVGVFRESGLTRIPVFDGTLDTPLGLVNLKDFALKHGFNPNGENFELRGMLRPLLYVPPSMPLGILLQKMQAERIHMALVIDEYGGTDGLVTIEDLIETVVGEIEDEHDVDEAQGFVEEKPGIWTALAKTPLADFEAAIGRRLTDHDEIDEEEVDTLGGLVFMLAGHVPARGEVVRHPDGPEFEVTDADPRRIKRLRVRLTPAPDA